jgi:hypothetical protein
MWFILLLLITTAAAFPMSSSPPSTTTSFFYDSALGGSCDSDSNCGGLVGNSRCLNGICTCRSGYIPQGIMSCVYAQGMKNLSFCLLIVKWQSNTTISRLTEQQLIKS